MDEATATPPPPGEKPADEAAAANGIASNGKTTAAQCSVVLAYQVSLAGAPRGVTVTWSKSLINHSLSVSVDRPGGDPPFACKVDLKPWPFWSKKGLKSFDVASRRVDLFWDLRSARFSGGPEPSGGYYVALVSNDEVVLLIGDCKKEAYKRTKSRPSLQDATLVSKRENVFGKRCFSTRAKFDERRKEHEILVEINSNSNSSSGPREPEMRVTIDGAVLIRVDNLQWKFRGNNTVMVEQLPVQVFWDVHDWLFGGPGTGHALLIFKPGAAAMAAAAAKVARPEEEQTTTGSDGGAPACACGQTNEGEFCFFLYAWKME